MKKLEAEVQQLDSNVSQRMQCVIEEARAERSLADERLALAFRRFASAYDGSASTSVPKTSPDPDQFYDVMMPAHLTMNEEEMADAAATTPSPIRNNNRAQVEEDVNIRCGMKSKHPSLDHLWCEWFGLDVFEDDYGGLAGREAKFGTQWRNKGSVSPHQFSRTNRVIVGIKAYAAYHSINSRLAVSQIEDLFQQKERCNCSVSKIVIALQAMGFIAKREPRPSKKKN